MTPSTHARTDVSLSSTNTHNTHNRRVDQVAARLLSAGLISDAAAGADVFTRLALIEKQFKEARCGEMGRGGVLQLAGVCITVQYRSEFALCCAASALPHTLDMAPRPALASLCVQLKQCVGAQGWPAAP